MSGSRRTKETLYLIGLLIAPMGLLVVLVADAVRQRAVKQQIDARVVAMRDSGLSTTGFDELEAYEARTERDQSGDIESAVLASERFGSSLRRDVRDMERVVPPGQPWDAAAYVEYRLDQDQVFLETLPTEEEAKGIWEPNIATADSGFYERGPDLMAFHKIAGDAFRQAFHEGNLDRALDLLPKLQTEINPSIRESLQSDVWTAEHLAKLRIIASEPIDAPKRWQGMCRKRLARMVVTMQLDPRSLGRLRSGRDPLPFQIPPSHVWEGFDYFDQASNLQPAGTIKHVLLVNKLSHGYRVQVEGDFPAATGIPFAKAAGSLTRFKFSLTPSAIHLARVVIDQKWTVAAIAVRQFQKQEGRLPENIEDLKRVGLTNADLQLTPRLTLALERDGDLLRLSSINVQRFYSALSSGMYSEQLITSKKSNFWWTALELQK